MVIFIKRSISILLILALVFTLSTSILAEASDGVTKQSIVNSASLNPETTGQEDLDNYVGWLLSEITTEDMDTNTKLNACYQYLAKNMRYGSFWGSTNLTIGNTTCGNIYNNYGNIEGQAALGLVGKVGWCNTYSSAFVVLARRIGLDAKLAAGTTRSARGGQTVHQWATIDIGDTTYIFDTQLQQNAKWWTDDENFFYTTPYADQPGRFVFSHNLSMRSHNWQ